MTRLVFAAVLVIGGPALLVAAAPAAQEEDGIEKKVEELAAKLGDVDFEVRDAARDELYKLGRPAVAHLKKAAEKRRASGSDDDLKVAGRVDKVVREIEKRHMAGLLEKYIPAGIESPGHFDRDYSEVLAVEGAVPALKDVFMDEDLKETVRSYAGDALIQAADRSVIPDLKKIATDDIERPAIRHQAAAICYHLGEKKPLEDLIADAEKKAKEGREDPGRFFQAMETVANLYYRARLYDKAAGSYLEIEKVLGEDPRFAKSAGRAIIHYNLACVYSLAGKIDEALKALETSFECGYQDFKWLEIDGDLDKARKDPRFGQLVDKHRAKEKEEKKPAKEG